MKHLRRIVLLCTALAALGFATQAPAANAQQERMSTCNAEARTQSLAGAERRSFMQRCLRGEEGSGKALTAQQQKMKTCSAEAKTKALKGAERRKFMSGCLKGR